MKHREIDENTHASMASDGFYITLLQIVVLESLIYIFWLTINKYRVAEKFQGYVR